MEWKLRGENGGVIVGLLFLEFFEIPLYFSFFEESSLVFVFCVVAFDKFVIPGSILGMQWLRLALITKIGLGSQRRFL